MKIKELLISNLDGIRKGFSRFPLAILSSIALSFLLSYNEFTRDIRAYELLNSSIRDVLYRVFTVSIFLFIFISLLNQLFSKSDKKTILLVNNAVGIVLMVLLFFYTKSRPSLYSGRIVYIIPALVIIFIMLSLFIECLYIPNKLESYIYEIIKSALISILFSGVILVGIELILFALSTLFFDFIDYRYYSSAAYIILITINLLVFLSYFPKSEDFEKIDIPVFLKILIGNIVTVLVSIFGIILYIYFVMILIQKQMPINRISYLVIIFGSASITLLILLNLIKRNIFTKIFSIVIPISIIPLTILMFFSMWTRINDYGFTANRYLVFVIGIWILLSVVYFLINRYKNNIPIFVVFALLTIVTIAGPISAYDISLNSQISRLEYYFNKNNMLVDGKLTPNKNVSEVDREQITSILQYLQYSKDIRDIRYINDIGEKFFENPKNYLGFDFLINYPTPNDNHIEFYRETITIDNVDKYNKVHKLNIYNGSILSDFKFTATNNILTIERNGDTANITFDEIREAIENLDKNENLEFNISLNDKMIKIVFSDLYIYKGSLDNSEMEISGTIILLER